MSSSDAATASRRQVLLSAFGASLGLGACTLRPLMHVKSDDNVRGELEAIKVTGLDGRLGQLVRTALLDEMNPTGADVPQRYILQVQLQRSASALGIQNDDTITRFNLRLGARFQLLDSTSGATLYASSVQRIASYNVGSAPFATLSAEIDAERRIAREVGSNIGTQLAVHFANQSATI